MKKYLFFLIIAAPLLSLAQERPRFGSIGSGFNTDRLERKVDILQQRIADLNHRLSEVEAKLGPGGGGHYPPVPIDVKHVCMLVDSGFTKTFLDSASTQIDAEYNVRKKCSQSVHTSYCSDQATLKCDSSLNTRGRGYICVLQDSGFDKVFRGEGVTQVEAEANAKMSCQNSVHPSYCGKVTPRCQEF